MHRFLADHPLVLTLLIVQGADIVSGICVAINRRELSSSVNFVGMTRKLVMWLIVGVAFALQRHSPDLPMGDGACLCYIGGEGLSLLENAALLGVPLPRGFKRALEKLHDSETSKRRSRRLHEIVANSVEVTAGNVVLTDNGQKPAA